MPIYEYQCQACQHQMERLQKISDEPLRDCPACHEPALKKLVSAAAFRLKGGGWYETDFKTGDNKRNLSSGSEGDGKKSDSKASESKPASSESKPAAKASGDK